MITPMQPLLELGIACLFILTLRGLTFPRHAYKSIFFGILGVSFALVLALYASTHRFIVLSGVVIGTLIGVFSAQKIKITELPQAIAILNGLGGLAAFLIACCAILETNTDSFDTPLSATLGIFTFSGSMVAFAKLQGLAKSNFSFFSHRLSFCIFCVLILSLVYYAITQNQMIFYLLSFLACLLGITLTLRVGGADMPIIIALLNAASGLDSAAIGFILDNQLLIITGALIGVSGSILSYIMCKAMNKKLFDVLFKFSTPQHHEASASETRSTKIGNAAEAAFIMENARKIIIVPGFGMAAAQAQYILKRMALLLHDKYKVDVKFAIHPVAGRMPGHMNVLLAEAGVPYDYIFGLEDINNEFTSADVAYVIGANDIVNPLAKDDTSSPIYGMPILDVMKAKTVFIIKRSLSQGYAGLDNPLFYADNAIMLFGDAAKVTSEIVKHLEQ